MRKKTAIRIGSGVRSDHAIVRGQRRRRKIVTDGAEPLIADIVPVQVELSQVFVA